jgi:hypothetical protein
MQFGQQIWWSGGGDSDSVRQWRDVVEESDGKKNKTEANQLFISAHCSNSYTSEADPKFGGGP